MDPQMPKKMIPLGGVMVVTTYNRALVLHIETDEKDLLDSERSSDHLHDTILVGLFKHILMPSWMPLQQHL